MEKKQNKYSIRKFSVGASSILIGSLLFLGSGTAQASEENSQQNDVAQSTQEVKGSNFVTDDANQNKQSNQGNSETEDVTTEPTKAKQLHNAQSSSTVVDSVKGMETNQNIKISKENNKEDVDLENNEQAKAKSEEKAEVDPQYNEQSEAKPEEKAEVDPQYNEQAKAKPEEKVEVDPQYNEQFKGKLEEKTKVDSQYNDEASVKTSTKQVITDNALTTEQKDKATDAKTSDSNVFSQNTDNKSAPVQQHGQNDIDETQQNNDVSLEQLQNELQSPEGINDENRDNKSNTSLKTLKDSAVATTPNQTQKTNEPAIEQPTKIAKQGQYKNDDPIILVHGFNGFTDDINPPILSHYWGGDKLNIRQDLQDNGYETYEASIGALSSNYDRAVELYYYIKGGTVDYGAAHAEKYGHERYGRTYEGVYKDWQPGQKVHLVAHSMGGQTVRQLEELLRNGNPEEIDYQKEHGGEIYPLYQGDHDNMITSITTLGTPHNGTVASDELGNEALIRQIVYDYVKFKGNTDSHSDFGLNQWGLKQKEGESYLDYVKRVKNSKLWKTQDNGFYDLSTEGAEKLNSNTSLNPNIVYKTYTGESTRPTLFGRQKSDLNMFLPFTLTGNVIGKTANASWRENDGLVSVVSSQHPNNQAYVDATDEIQKGVWQVTPVRHGWDHVDFVGQDSTDPFHNSLELQQFWHNIADELVRSEQLDA